MYAEFFGLSELPFNNTPDPRFFYPTPDHEEAFASMVYAVSEGKGFMLLTGEAGLGKTLLTKMVVQHFQNHLCAAVLKHTVTTGAEFLASVCDGFGLPVPSDAAAATYVRLLRDFLLAEYAHGTPTVLIIDEAHTLSREAFAQLRTLGNLEDENAKLLQTLIVGQPELRRIFQLPDMRQLRQRIFRTFHLHALTREQCRGYIQHRLNIAGSDNESVFDDSAIEVIHGYAKGLPRLINTVCDNAMLSAYSADRRTIDGEFTDAVITQMLTFEQRHTPRAKPPVVRAPVSTPASPAEGVSKRIRRVESEFETLVQRLGQLECRISETTGSAGPAPVQLTAHNKDDVLDETGDNSAASPQATAPKLADTLDTAEDKVRQVLNKTEQKLAAALQNADQRLTKTVRKSDDALRRIPQLAAAVARHDQRMHRLTSIVRHLAEYNRKEQSAPQESSSPIESEPRVGAATPAVTAQDRPLESPRFVPAASQRLEELTHRTRTALSDLRALVADAARPTPQKCPASRTAVTPPFRSPVSALSSEVKHLANLVESL